MSDAGEGYAWGGNENLQTGATEAASDYLPVPRRVLPALRVLQLSAGGMHSLALVAGGDVWCWGQALTSWGASGDTNEYAKQRQPVRVAGATNVVRIAAGAFHNLALTAAGHVLAWGNSDYGQLGLGSTTHVAEPHVVEELSKAGVTSLAAGGWHSAALTAGGVVFVWGRGEHGRLGLGEAWRDRLRPCELPLPQRVAHVSCGGTHSALLTEDGTLLTCGRPSFGRLGRATGPGAGGGPGSGNPNVPQPVELPPPPRTPGGPRMRWWVDAVSAGGRHTLALARAVLPGEGAAAAAAAAASPAVAAPVASPAAAAAPPAQRAAGANGARAALSFAAGAAEDDGGAADGA